MSSPPPDLKLWPCILGPLTLAPGPPRARPHLATLAAPQLVGVLLCGDRACVLLDEIYPVKPACCHPCPLSGLCGAVDNISVVLTRASTEGPMLSASLAPHLSACFAVFGSCHPCPLSSSAHRIPIVRATAHHPQARAPPLPPLRSLRCSQAWPDHSCSKSGPCLPLPVCVLCP